MVKKWLQKLHFKKGTLHQQMGYPLDYNIPDKHIDMIASANVGDTVHYDTNVGYKSIKVTRKLKKRAVLARNLRGVKN